MFPKEELPEFEVAIVELFQSSITCSLKILEAMGHALQLKVRHMSDLFLAVFHAGYFGWVGGKLCA